MGYLPGRPLPNKKIPRRSSFLDLSCDEESVLADQPQSVQHERNCQESNSFRMPAQFSKAKFIGGKISVKGKPARK
jgi:hypothetical protein